jgi:hypothetical protein
VIVTFMPNNSAIFTLKVPTRLQRSLLVTLFRYCED